MRTLVFLLMLVAPAMAQDPIEVYVDSMKVKYAPTIQVQVAPQYTLEAMFSAPDSNKWLEVEIIEWTGFARELRGTIRLSPGGVTYHGVRPDSAAVMFFEALHWNYEYTLRGLCQHREKK